MQEKRLPTPQGIRALREQLRISTDPDEQETVQELLDRARERVEAAIPEEALAVLAQISPVLLECYALLGQEIVPASPATPVEATMQREEQTSSGGTGTITPSLAALFQQQLAPSHVPHGTLLYTPPPVTSVMTLDPFQGAYKGLASVPQGRGKKASTINQPIAVHKAVYEAELARVGNAVSDPSYWLGRHNAMTIYFPGQEYEVEVGWLLGDYDPRSDVPAATDPTPEQIVRWMEDALDGEEWEIEVIKRHLRTPEQKAWMDQHDVSISDVLNGRTPAGLDTTSMLFNDWNAKLGVKVFGF